MSSQEFLFDARDRDGKSVPPGSGVIPILKELAPGELAVVGTGFFVTRYGLFATARHVLEELARLDRGQLAAGYVLEDASPERLVLRDIVAISFSTTADVALGQASHALPNNRVRLSFVRPAANERLLTYAYPENEVMKFGDAANPPILRANWFTGSFTRQVLPSEHPYIPHPYYETSVEIRSGASGSAIFNSAGDVVAIACRGWDFGGAEHQGDHLSSVVPVTQLLPIVAGCARVPNPSWEHRQIPESRVGAILTLAELVAYGHVDTGAFE